MELWNQFNEGMVRRVCRNLTDLEFDNPGHEVWVLATNIRRDMSPDITNAELNQLVGYSGGWAPGMIVCEMHQLQPDNPFNGGPPDLSNRKKRKEIRSILPEKTSRETASDRRRRDRFYVGIWATSRQILGKPFRWG
jgi:hypothetical protein